MACPPGKERVLREAVVVRTIGVLNVAAVRRVVPTTKESWARAVSRMPAVVAFVRVL
jgi:hypothetical protein